MGFPRHLSWFCPARFICFYIPVIICITFLSYMGNNNLIWSLINLIILLFDLEITFFQQLHSHHLISKDIILEFCRFFLLFFFFIQPLLLFWFLVFNEFFLSIAVSCFFKWLRNFRFLYRVFRLRDIFFNLFINWFLCVENSPI